MFEMLNKMRLSKEDMAALLGTMPEKIDEFERAYKAAAISYDAQSDEMFSKSVHDMPSHETDRNEMEQQTDSALDVIGRATAELAAVTDIMEVNNGTVQVYDAKGLPDSATLLTPEDIKALDPASRTQATGKYMQVDINDSMPCEMLLWNYAQYKAAKTQKEKMLYYHMFRQGLDIMDLDPVTYEMLGRNKNSMSYWLPAVSAAASKHGFFRIPETKIAKVPMPILQLSRLDYESLTPATLKVVDAWAMEVFGLDTSKTYFVKTGTYSSKFNFRNTKVTGEQEVEELGEYLLFIQNQAVMMAGPLSTPSIYGVSTTNEWVVREYIEDKENNPCIYKGMPLHTEYRVFIDCDTDQMLGIAQYWDPDLMKKRFSQSDNSPHDAHDYVIFKMYEETLTGRYEENRYKIWKEVEKILPDINLDGQWSLDIMQNGDDFWIIDMATADTSALAECVPQGLIKKHDENWIPKLQ